MTCVQVQFTVESPTVADELVASLLAARRIACGQRLGPITSRYRWGGEEVVAQEWLVVVKTTEAAAASVVDAVAAATRAEVPEVLVTPVTGGLAAYLGWVEDEVASPA